MKVKDNEVWVFSSRSDKDYEKAYHSESGSFLVNEYGLDGEDLII